MSPFSFKKTVRPPSDTFPTFLFCFLPHIHLSIKYFPSFFVPSTHPRLCSSSNPAHRHFTSSMSLYVLDFLSPFTHRIFLSSAFYLSFLSLPSLLSMKMFLLHSHLRLTLPASVPSPSVVLQPFYPFHLVLLLIGPPPSLSFYPLFFSYILVFPKICSSPAPRRPLLCIHLYPKDSFLLLLPPLRLQLIPPSPPDPFFLPSLPLPLSL